MQNTRKRLKSKRRRCRPAYIVAVYFYDQCYGGGEEGGWWYESGELMNTRYTKGFSNHDAAIAYRNRVDEHLDKTLNVGRRDVSSVCSEGKYKAMVWERVAPAEYPMRRPHYE